MKPIALWYSPIDSEYDGFVMADKITYVEKIESHTGDEITIIHLIDGTILRSGLSMKTLKARLESEEQ